MSIFLKHPVFIAVKSFLNDFLKQDLTHDLINSGRYDTRDDFTVVIQPFFKNTVLPYTEVFSFLANLLQNFFLIFMK